MHTCTKRNGPDCLPCEFHCLISLLGRMQAAVLSAEEAQALIDGELGTTDRTMDVKAGRQWLDQAWLEFERMGDLMVASTKRLHHLLAHPGGPPPVGERG